MAEPAFMPGAGGVVSPPPRFPSSLPDQPRRARVSRAFRGWARAVLGWAARPARLIPGLAAVGCAVAGSLVLWGAGVALLVAAGFLLLLDARTPRG